MSDQSTNCQSLGFPKTNTRMQFPAATRSAIPKIYGSIVRSDHLLVKLISTSGAADAATAAASALCSGWYCLGPMVIIILSSKLIGYWTFVDIVAIQMDGVVVWRQVSMYLHYWKFVAFTLNAWRQLWYNTHCSYLRNFSSGNILTKIRTVLIF